MSASNLKYNFKTIEPKWQKKWEEKQIYFVDTEKQIKTTSKPKYYVLDMLPYPSGAGMHVGHLEGYVATDIVSRYMRMKGHQVVHPMGWDSFGLPAENYALKVKKHPKQLNKELVANFKNQLQISGLSYDWTKEINSSDSEYIKWTQWFFLLLYKKGLAYRAEAPVNWCPSCQTVLANEQVIKKRLKTLKTVDEKVETSKFQNFETNVCERCDCEVVKKPMKQWFFKITDYADRLLEDLKKLDWPESTKTGQKNWIGKKQGVNITYQIENSKQTITCFTTRPDTNFGATFIVLGPEHPLLHDPESGIENKQKVQNYINETKNKSEIERIAEGREKTGVFTGLYAINNLNQEKLPIWVSDFVLGNVGTGAVVGVPGHDKRDFEFATKFNLPIIRVVVARDGDTSEITSLDQVEEREGTVVNSQFLDGMNTREATKKITNYLKKRGWGKQVVNYKLRDWLISRQRYWGAPIPIIYCDKCGEVPLKIQNLPLELPDIKDIKPKGQAPLASDLDFVNTKCPKCGGGAKRETDTMDGFVDNSWYYFRYLDPHNSGAFCSSSILKNWTPVDLYVGGAEHTVGHLNYSRFFTKVLYDEGYINFKEPFLKLRHPGIVLAEDSRKMSKRWGNVVNPNDVIDQYGADTIRLYEMFMGPFSDSIPWSSQGLIGCSRFLEKVWKLYQLFVGAIHELPLREQTYELSLQRKLHQTIKKVGEDIENFKFNTAIATMMEFVNKWTTFLHRSALISEPKQALDQTQINKSHILSFKDQQKFLLILAPFAPHITEELWQRMKTNQNKFQSIHQQKWPIYDQSLLIKDEIEIPVQINGKLRFSITLKTQTANIRTEVEKIALADERAQKWIAGKEIKKIIFVPGKLVNLVVN